MKLKLATGIISLLTLTTSCTRSLDSNNATNVVTEGTWRITLFTDSGNDETSDFSGYGFSFNSSGVMTAISNGISKNGTWSTGSNKFNIDLGAKTDANKPLGELTDDWQIISISDIEINLTDDNIASTEFLTFKKN
ncbi:MAG TPA: hypothetical protein VFP97_03175 [Chitinophagaceae bacterium]|nr:hypothetical protein [Chitinophagaceae bacterium]